MSRDDKFEFESVQDRHSIQDYLQALQHGFEQGRIVLNTDGNEIIMHPAGYMKFGVTVKKKGAENKLTVKIGWKDRTEENPDTSTISITS